MKERYEQLAEKLVHNHHGGHVWMATGSSRKARANQEELRGSEFRAIDHEAEGVMEVLGPGFMAISHKVEQLDLYSPYDGFRLSGDIEVDIFDKDGKCVPLHKLSRRISLDDEGKVVEKDWEAYEKAKQETHEIYGDYFKVRWRYTGGFDSYRSEDGEACAVEMWATFENGLDSELIDKEFEKPEGVIFNAARVGLVEQVSQEMLDAGLVTIENMFFEDEEAVEVEILELIYKIVIGCAVPQSWIGLMSPDNPDRGLAILHNEGDKVWRQYRMNFEREMQEYRYPGTE